MTRSRLALFVASMLVLAATPPATAQPSAEGARRVEALLRAMTLEEKVGQMTQLALATVSSRAGDASTRVQLDSAKLENAVVRRHVGSLLNVNNVAMSPQEWNDAITMIQR